jgi:hypothetical protein
VRIAQVGWSCRCVSSPSPGLPGALAPLRRPEGGAEGWRAPASRYSQRVFGQLRPRPNPCSPKATVRTRTRHPGALKEAPHEIPHSRAEARRDVQRGSVRRRQPRPSRGEVHRTLTWGPISQQWFAAGWEGAASQTDTASDRPADPPPLKGGKQRITLVHELPRDHAGRILWAEDPMSAVRAMCGRSS